MDARTLIWTVPALAVVLLSTAACDIAASAVGQKVWREDKRFAVSGKPTVELQTFDGSIQVRAGAANEVLVTIERHASTEELAKSMEVATEQTADRIGIRAVRPPHAFGWGTSRWVGLIVTVPPNTEISARSGDGSIRVEGVSGGVKSHTGDGSIKVIDANGAVEATSGDGSVVIDGKISQLRARSGDGSITIEAAAGSATGADWDVSTGDGSVKLTLPADFGAELEAHTGDGGIHLQDVTVTNVSGEMNRNDLRGRLGNGGNALRVRTGDGSITLRRHQ